MQKLQLILFLICYVNFSAQSSGQSATFNFTVYEVYGDLNKDGLSDKVLITQDTINDQAPYLLQIFFNDNGKYQRPFVSTSTFIQPKFPNGKEDPRSFSSLAEVMIVKGILIISSELIRGNFNYKFRFQNGAFQLIGYTEITADNGHIYFADFNLSTGVKLRRTETFNNKIVEKSREIQKINPLPDIKDIISYENDDYLR